jgi:hypothetical protein
MGVLYDVVQQTIGEPAGIWHWCRVLWGQLREPFYNEHCRETCRKLLSETGVAMEFHWRDLDYHASCLDLNVLDFNNIFRCDEHCDLSIRPKYVKGNLASQTITLSAEAEI